MIRSVEHLLLILVVLVCPAQCVIGGDVCCASTAAGSITESSVESDSHCATSRSCCHHVVDSDVPLNVVSDQPIHFPHSDNSCECDCLCKGAIAASVQIAQDFLVASLAFRDACCVVTADAFCPASATLDALPDPISGREIRTLQMSFQV